MNNETGSKHNSKTLRATSKASTSSSSAMENT